MKRADSAPPLSKEVTPISCNSIASRNWVG
jgi:hypothetical protein